jgi:thiamine pyrophosphate-dependent acetolactate synthase large subunit-like protein
MAIKRDACGRSLRTHLGKDALVVAGLGSAGRTWRAHAGNQPSYYVSDPMGIGVTMALGLSLARPKQDVLYVGGDGDLVMNLGCLLTVVGANVRNLKIAIFDNRRYETGGGAPLPGSEHYSLAALARGAGFPYAAEVTSEAELEQAVRQFYAQNGLAFLALRVDMEASPYGPPPNWSQAEDRAVFMRQLAGEI